MERKGNKLMSGISFILPIIVFIWLILDARCSRGEELPLGAKCALAFECVKDIQLANATASWTLLVHPERLGYYSEARWQIKYRDPKIKNRGGSYKAVLDLNGDRPHYDIFRRHHLRWHRLPHGSAEYRLRSWQLAYVFFVAQGLRQGVDPSSVLF